jgi:hypothetical protein
MLGNMSHLHLLLEGGMLPRPPEGYVTRQRIAVEGADLDALDAEVEAAGGWIATDLAEPNAVLPGIAAPAHDMSWYVLPGEAVGEERS